MNITLQTLVDFGACEVARRAFIRHFGKNGAPTAKEVFHALAENKQADWLFWLVGQLTGFIQAVGDESNGNFYCAISGELEVNAGFVISSGSSTVRASGSSTVRASGSSTVEAYDSSTVEAYDSSTVEAYGSSTVRAYDSSTVEAYGSSTVRAYGSSTVRAYGSSTVEAYDSSTVLMTQLSLNVSLEIKSDNACAVDRRHGRPQLILAENR